MIQAARRPLPRAVIAAAAPLMLMACAGAGLDAAQNPVVGVDVAPSAPCNDQALVPQIFATNAALLPADAWTRSGEWESRLTFRIDAKGVPVDVRATVGDESNPADPFVAAGAAALAEYRFCPPRRYSTETRWRAAMRFRHGTIARAAGGGEMIVQMFVPAYTRDDVFERRSGTVRVAGTFGSDGRPSAVRLVASSGDHILDRKSLEAMASWQLIFAPGTMPTRPIVYQQPYVYAIR